MNKYNFLDIEIDSVDLKALVVSKGVRISKEVYKRYTKTHRLGINPLMCNCMLLSDGTVVQITDTGFHLKHLTGILSWNNLKLLKYASELNTPYSIRMQDDKAALFYDDTPIDFVTFPPKTDFYFKKTSSGLPFIGNTVIQGIDWVAFPCLWACEYAAAGKPCQFCFSGAEFELLAKKNKPLTEPVNPSDFSEIVEYAVTNAKCNSIQITGGSTLDYKKEYSYINSYLNAIKNIKLENMLLYITPPQDKSITDEYFSQGATQIACSLELWDEKLAEKVTPGKIMFTTRKRCLEILEYIAGKYGTGRAFSNFIIGIEPFESLKEGASYLAERGIIPTASVWMSMGRPVMGNMQPPDVYYYKKVKELFAELYQKYNLEPAKCRGLNVCIERDIWNYATQ